MRYWRCQSAIRCGQRSSVLRSCHWTCRRSGRPRSRKAILRLTRDEGKDPIDGSELNAVRRTALERLRRTDDDLTDAEIFARQGNDGYWFVDLCLEKLHRLPIEVEPL